MLGALMGTTTGRLGPAAKPGSRPLPRPPWFGSVSCVSLRLLQTLPPGSPLVPSSLLPAPEPPAGPHLPCPSFHVCAQRGSLLNVGAAGRLLPPLGLPKTPRGTACGLTLAWLDAKAAALLSLSRVWLRRSPTWQRVVCLTVSLTTASPREPCTVAVHPQTAPASCHQSGCPVPAAFCPRPTRAHSSGGPEAAAGPLLGRLLDSGCVSRDRQFLWTRPRRLALASPAAPSPGRGQARRGLSATSPAALILCLCLWGFYRFPLINSVRS